jgi:Mn-containing catalase
MQGTNKRGPMFFHIQKLINDIPYDEPDPAAANALQEGLGGQFGEMRTMMQYLFQSFNARGDAKPFKDLIQGVGIEEISHVELITTTINRLLDGSPRYQGNGNGKRGTQDRETVPGSGGSTPLRTALSVPNIHHLLVAPQCALPVDAAGNPWLGSYVYASGNLTLDLLYNLMLEATGRLQKCRLYEMSDNKTFRATVSFLIARDHGHELVFAKALESLGVDWGRTLPIPNFDATQWPEVKRLMDERVHLQQHHFRLDSSLMSQIVQGNSPSNDGSTLETTDQAPEGFPIEDLPERPEEFSPGLSPELKELVEAAAELELGRGRTQDPSSKLSEAQSPRSKRVRMKK